MYGYRVRTFSEVRALSSDYVWIETNSIAQQTAVESDVD